MFGSRVTRRSHRAAIAFVVGVTIVGALAGGLSHAEPAGTSQTIERITTAPDPVALRPAQRLTPPPVVEVVAPPIPIDNVSTCRTRGTGAVAVVSIPSISYRCPVFAGGQSTIDSGAATWVTGVDDTPMLADAAGATGAVWLAGHRTAHGGAFAAIPDLTDGAIITIEDASGTWTYRVVGRLYVGVRNGVVVGANGQATNAATLDALFRPDHGGTGLPARLILQTCDGADFRWMIYADLVVG